MWKQALLVLTVVAAVHAASVRHRTRRSLEEHDFYDCGKPDKIIRFSHLSFNPSTIIIPGNITISFAAELTQQVENMAVQVEISKRMGNEWFYVKFPIPCINEVGSCTYNDMCSRMNDGDREPVLTRLRQAMIAAGGPSECPIEPAVVNLQNLQLEMPTPSLLAPSTLIDGWYEMKFIIHENENPANQYGCMELKAKIGTV